MALTVSFQLTSRFDQVQAGTLLNATVRVHNPSASSVTVATLKPVITPLAGAYLVGDARPEPGGSWTIAAGGTQVFGFSMVLLGPELASTTFTVTATATLTDGTAASAPARTVTTAARGTAAPSVAGQFLFDSPLNSGNVQLW